MGQERWYIISSAWLDRWRYYLDDTSGLVEPPGPVSNASDLLQPDGLTPRSGLAKQKDYRGVVKEVWDFFMQHYGGGPAIAKTAIDIYEGQEGPRANVLAGVK